MTTVSLKLPDDLAARLSAAAEELGATKSAVVRRALDAYLIGKRQMQGKSFLALAGEGIGCVAGPGDLSTNPDYLRDFGK